MIESIAKTVKGVFTTAYYTVLAVGLWNCFVMYQVHVLGNDPTRPQTQVSARESD